jgi:GTPase-activator protein for Ras-like GTPase
VTVTRWMMLALKNNCNTMIQDNRHHKTNPCFKTKAVIVRRKREMAEVRWSSAAFLEAASRYTGAIRSFVLPTDPKIAIALASCADVSEHDALSALLVRMGLRAQGFEGGKLNSSSASSSSSPAPSSSSSSSTPSVCLRLIRALIADEFASKLGGGAAAGDAAAAGADQSGAVMRGNTLASKISGQFVRQTAIAYVRSIVSPSVEAIVRDSELDLEVDPRKVGCAPDDEAALHPRRLLLAQTAQMLLDHITSNATLSQMPREVRAITGVMRALSLEFGLAEAQADALVGGFIMLRVFSPALVTPESWGVIEDPPPPRARRNLVLLVKLLQNASNGVAFSAKEPFMQPFNSFVEQNRGGMKAYLSACSVDPEDRGWEDLLRASEHPIDFDITKFDLQDLFEFHRQLAQVKGKLVPALLRLKKEALESQPQTAGQTSGWTSAAQPQHTGAKAVKESIDAAVAVLQQVRSRVFPPLFPSLGVSSPFSGLTSLIQNGTLNLARSVSVQPQEAKCGQVAPGSADSGASELQQPEI